MESFWERAKWMVLGLAFGTLSAGLALAQDDNSSSLYDTPAAQSSQTPTPAPCPCPNKTPCRETGDSNPPDLALTPDQWPSTSQGLEDDQFDSLKTHCPNKDDYYCVPPRCPWYMRGEGGGMHRSPTVGVNFQAQAILPQTLGSTVSGSEIMALSTSHFNYDWAAAGHFTIGHTINEDLQLEASYLGVASATNTQAVRDPGANLFSPFSNFGFYQPITGLDNNTFAQIRYESALQGAELNIRRQLPMPPEQLTVSALFGVRYLSLPEKLYYRTQCAAGDVDIAVNCGNQMVGPQVGALFEFYVENRWWINFEMKAALLNDSGQQTTDYTITGGSYAGSGSNSVHENHTAFAGDLNLTCIYRWSPHFTTRLGYQALWLCDMVLAQNNFSNNIDIVTAGPAQLVHNTNTVYHGPFAGIEIAW